mmetsp:Transcript_14604/g.25455  ORF Transcript_14604/g.25455 Transcript_14604/m.25455 type:complete len:86 (-) Transcript_14604:152-409(-)
MARDHLFPTPTGGMGNSTFELLFNAERADCKAAQHSTAEPARAPFCAGCSLQTSYMFDPWPANSTSIGRFYESLYRSCRRTVLMP